MDERKPDVLTITFTRDPWQIKIDGDIENLNVGLAMIEEAKRTLETQYRIAEGLKAQQAHSQQIKDNARVASLIDRTLTMPKRN